MTTEPIIDGIALRGQDRITTDSIPGNPPDSPLPSMSSSPYGKPTKPVKRTTSKKTGGEVSRKEIILVIALTLVILVVAVVTISVLVLQKNNNNVSSSILFASKQIKKDFILDALEKKLSMTLADDDDEAEPFLQAVKWIVEEDSVEESEQDVLVRFALATLYYANGGAEWSRSNNWMSTRHETCEWEGVGCSLSTNNAVLQELDLSNNHLTGTLSPALVLLKDLNILWLDKNEITGPIRGDVFGALPNLAILYLQDNQLTGPIPKELRSNGMLCKSLKYRFEIDSKLTNPHNNTSLSIIIIIIII